MIQIFHSSYDLKYRCPFGAAVINSTVKLSIQVPNNNSCFVRLWENGKGETLIPMSYDNKNALFSTDIIMPEYSVLIWYYFIVIQPDGNRLYYGSDSANLGGPGKIYTHEPPSWQITVYKPDYIPDWYKNAVVYQIFPDRFARGNDWQKCQETVSALPKKGGPSRSVRKNWYETPSYRKNTNGDIIDWDFYGGNLTGICEKLPYLKSLGVTVLYLNPIFRSPSNHKYDTSDYTHVDDGFGGDEALSALIREADKFNIKIILDGVFSHTGADSVYFNKYGNFNSVGAYQSKSSPYYKWYNFEKFPDEYDCWWGVKDLPNVNERDEWYSQFIYGGDGSIIRHWLRAGIKGWRLDVADELPDSFIKGVRSAMVDTDPDSLLLGEVWEDASNKFSHGEQREYLYGNELQSVMNYLFKDASIAFIMGGSAENFCRRLMSLKENYPPEHFYANLNLIGSHDTCRILTILGEAPEISDTDEKRSFRLSDDMYNLAKQRLILLSLIQFSIPGVPCIYYGDEAGMQGYEDPFNRAAFPWGHEDSQLTEHFRFISHLRHEYALLIDGDFTPLTFGEHVFGCLRQKGEESILLLVNAARYNEAVCTIPKYGKYALDLLRTERINIDINSFKITLAPLSASLIYFSNKPFPQKRLTRSAGILCHVTSVPACSSTSALGDDMFRFIDFLKISRQKLWQILPLNPPDEFGSPYTSCSAFAGNPALIDITSAVSDDGFVQFCDDNTFWLDDFALYSALRSHFGTPWQAWPKKYRDRLNIDEAKIEFADKIGHTKREQYSFSVQWCAVKKYANKNGIEIIGDIPLFVSSDSADVWAHRDYFILDSAGMPILTAGAPPDSFSNEGQNWNTPVYNWARMKASSYKWWRMRLSRCMQMYDHVRLDHFRGLSAGYTIKNGEKTKNGFWLFGPGLDFFKNILTDNISLIAEDLGFLDRSVYNLLELTGLPGMNIWQFNSYEMTAMDKECAMHRIFYSGTHDNDTLLSWCSSTFPDDEPKTKAAEIIENLYASSAGWVILPLQDVFMLGTDARMNTPGISSGNWQWKAETALPFDEAEKYLSALAKKYGR